MIATVADETKVTRCELVAHREGQSAEQTAATFFFFFLHSSVRARDHPLPIGDNYQHDNRVQTRNGTWLGSHTKLELRQRGRRLHQVK